MKSPPLPGRQHATSPPVARILIVDDQPANIQVAGSLLGRLGHEIVPASDGPTALKRLAARPADLILLDLLMPGMDGCELCRRIHENPEWRGIPVIFLSAADDKDFIVRALEAGGVDYVTKPFHQAELVSRVRTQLALKFARDRLAHLAEDKDELLGILAHDLKNHLGSMQMSAQILCERVLQVEEKRLAQLAENILQTSDQLLSFVRGFLANMAAEHQTSLQSATIDLTKIAGAVVQQNQEAARRKRITVQTHIPEEGVEVLGDSLALGQVLDNLVSNAIKFSPPDRSVEITVEVKGDHGEVQVRDQGPGFKTEDRVQMFRRYGRLSARPTAGEPSTGLGLSIVRKLVHAMRGEVRCETAPGEGATFVVRLPRPSAP